MKYLPINNQLFINNRKRFSALLKPNSVAIFNSNDILPTNADGSLKFKQNSDLFYLSGIDQEESILVIYPDAKDGIHKEVLFLKETNEHIAIWEGHKLTKSEALTVSGIQKVYWLSEFKTVLRSLLAEAEFIYLNTNEHVRAVVETETREARFVKWCMNEYPVHKFERSAPLMHNLRAIKQDT
ncbi:MAG: aminopeptidase P N-terminal domain-containing protein, partial [Bacteroidia bacterium]